jgi:hypothetical protein
MGIMRRTQFGVALAVVACGFVVSVVVASQPQDRFSLTGATDVRSPNGIALSEFKGYEAWQAIAPSLPADGVKLIVGNPAMIKAYSDGAPGNGNAVPDGAVMAKIAWTTKANPFLPGTMVPDALRKVQFMLKDTRRFPDTDGWGYADFLYDSASGTFKAAGNGPGFATAACHQCHIRVRARDFVFTDYARRR